MPAAFPLWLAPVQVEVCPVSEKVADYAKHVTETLKRHKPGVSISTTATKNCPQKSATRRCEKKNLVRDGCESCQGKIRLI